MQALSRLLLLQHALPEHHIRLRALQQAARYLPEDDVRQRPESLRTREIIHQGVHTYAAGHADWIEKRLVDAEQKAKKNILVIDNKTSYTTERPKQVLDRIMAIEEEIEKTM